MLKTRRWEILVQLGEGGFQDPQAAGAFTAPYCCIHYLARQRFKALVLLMLLPLVQYMRKQKLIQDVKIKAVAQAEQLDNPDARVILAQITPEMLLGEYAFAPQGIKTGDDNRWRRYMWEIETVKNGWQFYQSTVDGTLPYGG